MKLRVEYGAEQEEVVIRCHRHSELTDALVAALDAIIHGNDELLLYSDGAEYYIDKASILFFESGEGNVYAHTVDQLFRCEYKLYELEMLLPSSFVRTSKSMIVNIKQISSLKRELTGNGELRFKGCDKRAYFSRGYYHHLKDRIDEVRLGL